MEIIFKQEESSKIKEMFNLDWDDFYTDDKTYGLVNAKQCNGRLLIGELMDFEQMQYKPVHHDAMKGEFTFNSDDYILSYKTKYGELLFKHKSSVNKIIETDIAKLEAQIAELRKQLV